MFDLFESGKHCFLTGEVYEERSFVSMESCRKMLGMVKMFIVGHELCLFVKLQF